MSRPYQASEDSAPIREVPKTYSGGSALEIGAGNCGNLVMLAKGFETAVGTDIVRPRMTDWIASGADFLLADGSSCL